MTKYKTYLSDLEKSLQNDGYSTKRSITHGGYKIHLWAERGRWEASKFGKMSRSILVTSMKEVKPNAVMDYSAAAFDFALENRGSLMPRGMGGSLFAAPVVVTTKLKPEMKAWIQKTLAKKHWAAMEFPVLVSLNEKGLYYCKKTPMWGAAYYKGFREFIEMQLGFW